MKPVSSEQAFFAEALLCPDTEARAAYLDGACGSDTALRRRVEALLRAAEGAGDFLECPPDGLYCAADSTSLERELCEKPGDRIGRYKLLEKIGEGGCGIVYMAEQEEPVRRRVALKVIKLGMDTRQVVARFEAERQALALMDHVGIAKVFDGGATQSGRPYFVMELVRGVRITEFCDEARFPSDARLRLYVQVCQAVQHAHQKGIIHRDLKPSNILVTVNDGVPVPKVIDFGIAKATGTRLTEKTVFTQFHSFIGTPAYTSPEQAEMSSVDIDTRSDIYSLGVLLYELLTGRTPFDGAELLRSGLDEMRRVIREKEPVTPSSCLSSLGLAEATALSGKRQVNIPGLVGAVRGDLDWVVMKCLEKDRSRRYETANGLAVDIERHLKNEPVTARPPSRLYLLQKLAQRNRGFLTATTLVFVALLVAVLALATSNSRIRRERNQKNQALLERGAALAELRTSEQRARDQLFESLQSQAQARRNSRRMGQRIESLAAIADAARIRFTPDLRDGAIAALAVPDIRFGYAWPGWKADTRAFGYDSFHGRYARLGDDGVIEVRSVTEDHELQSFQAGVAGADYNSNGVLSFSPDGRHLIWLSERGETGVWIWESGESVFVGDDEPCHCKAFSPDSRQLALGYDEYVRCIDLRTGQEIGSWPVDEAAYSLEFDPRGGRLAVGHAAAGAVSLFDLENGRPLAELPAEVGVRQTVAWHPDGKLLAIGGSDSRIQIWDVDARRKVTELVGHVQDITFLNFDRTGEMLESVSWDGTLRLWQPSPGRQLLNLPISGWVAFSRNQRWPGVISPANGQVQLWEVVPSEEYHTFLNPFPQSQSGSYDGAISPDGRLLAIGGTDGVRLWDLMRGRQVAWLEINATYATAFCASGRELLTCGPFDGLNRWPIESPPAMGDRLSIGPARPIALPFAPKRMSMGADGRTLVVVGEEAGQSLVFDLAHNSVKQAGMVHPGAGFAVMTSNMERMATSGWLSENVKLWNMRNGSLVLDVEPGLMTRVFFSPDDRQLIVSRANEFTFYDLETLAVCRRLPRAMGLSPGHVTFSSDGKLMAVEMAPGVIHLMESSSARTIAKLEDPNGDLSTWMSFTPDTTQFIVAARHAGTIHRWDLGLLRASLKEMNLDWDWPDFPEHAAGNGITPDEPGRRAQLLRGRSVEGTARPLEQP